MAKKLLLSCFIIVAFFSKVIAQGGPTKVGKNVFYAEWYGNGIYYSLNYEKTLRQRTSRMQCVRVGAMIYPSVYTRNGWIFAFPFETNFLFGKRTKKLELGFGNTFTTGKFYHMADHPKKGFIKDYYQQFILTGRIGYRVYSEGGFVFRGGILPLLVYKPGYVPETRDSAVFGSLRKNPKTFDVGISCGLSFGYSF